MREMMPSASSKRPCWMSQRGLSGIAWRAMHTMMAATPMTANTRRHDSCPSGLHMVMKNRHRNMPMGEPQLAMVEPMAHQRPRRATGANSLIMLKLVTSSDPRPRPTKKRMAIMNVMFGESAPKMVAKPNSSRLNWNALRRPSLSPIRPAISEPMNKPKKPADRNAAVCSLVANPVSVSVLFTPPAR